LLETLDTAGTGGEAFEFGNFGAVDLDDDGNTYVLDASNNQVHVLDSQRELITSFGGFGRGEGQFIGASDLAVDSQGNVYVADWQRADVQKFSPDGTLVATLQPGSGQFETLARINTDSRDNLYVPDGGRVYQFAPDGTLLMTIEDEERLGAGIDVAVDVAGHIYVSDVVNSRVQVYDTHGEYLGGFGSPGSEPGQFVEVDALALDDEGHLYVLDFGNKRIQMFDVSSIGE
jgi:sugar lactone lactonase YvrE